jgi:hypothetical protein
MKKFLLIAVLACVSTAIMAQKGSMYIGGGLGYMKDYWKVAPEAGYWVADDLQLGLVLTIESIDKETNFAPHVYFRKWYTITEKFSLYSGVNARLQTNPDYIDEGDATFDFFIDAGMAYAIAPRWGIVGRLLSLGYIADDFTLDFNMSPQSLFNVGIYYTFKE